MTVNSDGSRIYLTMHNSGVAVIDGFTHEVITYVPAGHNVAYYPNHIVVHPDDSKIYVGNRAGSHDGIAVIDATTNTLITDILLIGQDVFGVARPEGISLHPDGSKIYVVNGEDDNVVVLGANTNSLIGFIPVRPVVVLSEREWMRLGGG